MASSTKASFRYPAAVVTWLDAHARNQAVEYEEAEVGSLHRPEECKILALVIKDDETGLSIYNEETGPTSIRGVSFIPHAMIKDVIYVNLTKLRKPRHAATKKSDHPARHAAAAAVSGDDPSPGSPAD